MACSYDTVGKFVVRRSVIAGTELLDYSAWEPCSFDERGLVTSHSTITTINGSRYGRIGCRRLPKELAAMPAGTRERFGAVQAFQDSEYQRAYSIIRESAFAEDWDAGRLFMGAMEFGY